jgi:cell division protein FtsB
MARRSKALAKLNQLERVTRWIDGTRRLAFLAFCVAVGFVVVATAVPQKRKLDELEMKLVQAEEREERVRAEKEYYETELRALRDDPEFLEVQARDRLGYYREGERVLKFREER